MNKPRSKVYLSSGYHRLKEMMEYKRHLENNDFYVMSRWINSIDRTEDPRLNNDQREMAKESVAVDCFDDLKNSDILIVFTGGDEKGWAQYFGGVGDIGAGIALDLLVIAVGPKESIMQWHPSVINVENFGGVIDLLVHDVFKRCENCGGTGNILPMYDKWIISKVVLYADKSCRYCKGKGIVKL